MRQDKIDMQTHIINPKHLTTKDFPLYCKVKYGSEYVYYYIEADGIFYPFYNRPNYGEPRWMKCHSTKWNWCYVKEAVRISKLEVLTMCGRLCVRDCSKTS